MSRLISRNPFARRDLLSRTEHYRPSSSCDNCGSPGRKLKSGLVSLKVYSIHSDGNMVPNEIHGKFCSLECCRSYHGNWGF